MANFWVRWLALIAWLALGFTEAALAQSQGNPGEHSTSASVRIMTPLTIHSVQDLRFGAFTKGPSFGDNASVLINPDGSRESDPAAAFAFVQASGGFGAAIFTVTGQPETLVSVLFPNGGTGPHGSLGPGMVLTNLNRLPAQDNPHALPASGEETFPVGGTLLITNADAVEAGTYTLGFTITVQYN